MKRIIVVLLSLVLCLTTGVVCYSEEVPEEVLTIENCPELAAVLQCKNEFDDIIKDFAKDFAGKIIEFDGNIAYLSNHESYKTRYDILVYFGDYNVSPMTGPSFQFNDVGISDLQLSESWSSDSVKAGTNVRIRAKVVEYKEMSGLFLLDPVSLEERTASVE